MDLEKLLKERRSVRTFRNEPLDPDLDRQLTQVMSRMPKCHFGRSTVRVSHLYCPPGTKVPGTYGNISGARHYAVLSTSGHVNPLTLIDAGMIGQRVVIRCGILGLGTCWMTGTIRDHDFGQAVGLTATDTLLGVIAIGYEAKPNLRERVTSSLARSRTRRPFDTMVFTDKTMTTPWHPGDNADDAILKRVLDVTLAAPSSLNRQPWRIVVTNGDVEIYNHDNSENSWISIGCAVTNYCAVTEYRGHHLNLDEDSDKPVVILPLPDFISENDPIEVLDEDVPTP